MEVKSFSKSGYDLFRICPERADKIRNQGYANQVGEGAKIGLQAHKFWELINTGQITKDGLRQVASDEVFELVDRARIYDRMPSMQPISVFHEKRFRWQINHVPTTAILDRLAFLPNKTIHITDLKTGYDETPNLPEMDIYVLAARQMFSDVKRIIFAYLWARTGHWTNFVYDWITPYHLRVTCYDTGYRRDLISTTRRGPLLLRVAGYIREMQQTPPHPRPGPHCENLYGHPCQFLGRGCSLSPDVPMVLAPEISPPEERSLIATNVLSLPPEAQPGAAFLAIRDGLPLEQSTPQIRSLAYQGVMQLRQGASSVAATLREWAKQGASFSIGNVSYGMRPKRITDVETALRLLLANNVAVEDLAQVCSISESSLKKLPKRKYKTLGSDIAEACVRYSKDREFGKL